MTAILRDRLDTRWDELAYKELFIEDLPRLEIPFDCAFSCLLFVHIVTEDNLRKAIWNVKGAADTVVICEHTDLSAQRRSSNFTRIWPRATYERLFSPNFREIMSHSYNYLGDKLELLVFQRTSHVAALHNLERFSKVTADVLKQALPRDSSSPPKEWQEWYTLFSCGGLWTAYEALIGSEEPNSWEFPSDRLLVRTHPELKYRLPKEVLPNEEELRMNIIKEIRNKGDFEPVDEPKARVQSIIPRQVDPIDAIPRVLEVNLVPMTYFQYLVMKRMINDPAKGLRQKYTTYRHFSPESLGELKTTNIGGCGVFCITQDGFIILSLRRMVAEHPGVISYSASGSMNWWYPGCADMKEANPFLTIMREGHEELGTPIDIDKVTLFAVGLDLTGMFVQFSFYANVAMDADYILRHWKVATAKYEQVPFVLPFLPTEVAQLVASYAMEPSAAATLIQLSAKRFGPAVMESHIMNAIKC